MHHLSGNLAFQKLTRITFLRGLSTIHCKNITRNSLLCNNDSGFQNYRMLHFSSALSKIKVTKATDQDQRWKSLGYEERNIRVGRALSPHLTIYSPQLTSIMSITTRLSGVALTLYAWSMGILYLLGPYETEQIIIMLEGLELGNTSLVAMKYVFALPIVYHILNGTRHLAWGYGYLLSLKEIYTSGYVVLALTPLVTAWLALL